MKITLELSKNTARVLQITAEADNIPLKKLAAHLLEQFAIKLVEQSSDAMDQATLKRIEK